MEATYDDVPKSIGLMRFAPVIAARGVMFGAEHRSAAHATDPEPAVSEMELCGPQA